MIKIHHLNCVKFAKPNDDIIGHCLLIEINGSLILIDAGFGIFDMLNPIERLGEITIQRLGISFNESFTAVRQIEKLGFDKNSVKHCIISHLDADHIGGLADFPNAKVHLSFEEYERFLNNNPRCLKSLLSHNPQIETYSKNDNTWFGFESRKIETEQNLEIYFIPLFGHTLGHCGVALKQDDNWLFYVADAYLNSIELTDGTHPKSQSAKMRAENDELRVQNLEKIKKLIINYPEIEVFCYHDKQEFMKQQNRIIRTYR